MDVAHQMYIHLRLRGGVTTDRRAGKSTMTTNGPERRALGDLRDLPTRGRDVSVFESHHPAGARRNSLIAVAQDKDKQKKSKKDAQLVLRLDKGLRDRFIDACQDLDTSAAREVRKFIKRFLRRYENGELDD